MCLQNTKQILNSVSVYLEIIHISVNLSLTQHPRLIFLIFILNSMYNYDFHFIKINKGVTPPLKSLTLKQAW